MADFMTRVELHDATYTDYEKLHTAMEAEGFSRKVLGSAGIWSQLPTAEFCRTTRLRGDQVRASAKRAANSTGKASAVLVTVVEGIWWDNLPTE